MNKTDFMQQYALARAGVINKNPNVEGIVEKAEIAFNMIEERCHKQELRKPPPTSNPYADDWRRV